MTKPTTAECIERIVREIHQDGFSAGIHGQCAFHVGHMDRFTNKILAIFNPKLLAADEAYEYGVRLFKILAPQCEPFEHFQGLISQLDNYIAGQNEKLGAADEMAKALENLKRVSDAVAWSEHTCLMDDEIKATDKALADYRNAGGK